MHGTTQPTSKLRRREYSPANKRSIARVFSEFIQEFPAAHALGFRFAVRNINSKYRQSFLGLLWAFLPPLATAMVWILLYQSKVVALKSVGVPYPLFVVTGTLLWTMFSTAVLAPMQTVQQNRSILVKINFPKEALLINAFYEILFNAAVVTIIITIELLIFRIPFTGHTLLYIPGVLLLSGLGMVIGLLLLPVSLLLKDIQFLLPSLLQFAMYLTPVVYAKPVYTGWSRILAYNPVTPVLTNVRAWLLNTPALCDNWQILAVGGAVLILGVLGIVLYRISLGYVIERMGS